MAKDNLEQEVEKYGIKYSPSKIKIPRGELRAYIIKDYVDGSFVGTIDSILKLVIARRVSDIKKYTHFSYDNKIVEAPLREGLLYSERFKDR